MVSFAAREASPVFPIARTLGILRDPDVALRLGEELQLVLTAACRARARTVQYGDMVRYKLQ
jgi:hypothetical protein